MLAEALSQVAKQASHDLSFVWISVNSLHEQSKEKLEKYFDNERLIECINISELNGNRIDQNEILFVNWESLNKEGNLFIKENEKDWNLSKVIENTKEEGREVVLIIDESHRAAKTSKSKEIIEIISPKLTVEVTATPKEVSCDVKITIPIAEVIEEEMIKREIQINQGLRRAETNEDVVEAALNKRRYLKRSYEEENSNVNPLLLIQIPNKKSTDIRSPEEKIIEILVKNNITLQNGKLALWLSERDSKINLESLEKNDNQVEVLLFKQAIAQGWDCPRAAILLLQREWNAENYEFNIQTLGRIMRMPEQKHYQNLVLNIGYVYTASDNFSIVEDLAKDYVSRVQMLRNNQIYKPIFLPSEFIRRKREVTRLSGKFKDCLLEASQEIDMSNKINTGIAQFKKDIGLEGTLSNINRLQEVEFSSVGQISKGREEVFSEYSSFLASHTSPFSKARSTEILKSSMRSLFKRTFGISNEDEIANIVINPVNKDAFIDLIDKAKEKYKYLPEREDVIVTEKEWQIPESLSIFDNSDKFNPSQRSIMQPFNVKVDKNSRLNLSKPEVTFIEELEGTDNDILWWFKNGDKESKFFGIAYKKDAGYYGFYPDFLIQTKKELIIVEIKDNRDFKNENLLKLNAGKEYRKKYKDSRGLYFFIISPDDYYRFFRCLKEQDISNFKSKYEENLTKYNRSRKVISEKTNDLSKEDKELLEMYDEELSKAIRNLEDIKLEKEILEINLNEAKSIIDSLKKKESELVELKVPKPFNICILGEVSDEDEVKKSLMSYFSKYGLKATDWEVEFFNNSKLKNSNVLVGLKKGRSRYSLIITGQIYHHSGKDNQSANLVTELKKPQYIDSIIGSSPTDPLTPSSMVEMLDQYLSPASYVTA